MAVLPIWGRNQVPLGFEGPLGFAHPVPEPQAAKSA